jgi:hypothetical protein
VSVVTWVLQLVQALAKHLIARTIQHVIQTN